MHPTPLKERQWWEEDIDLWLSELPPSPVPDFLTGLKPRPPDPRDHDLADHLRAFRVRDIVAESAPSGDLLSIIRGAANNQGAVPSCVSNTAGQGQSLFQQSQEGIWRVFDAARVHAETGSIMQGRYATDILKYGVQQGFPLAGSNVREKIAAYAFVQPGSGWFDTIVAWLSLGRPVWICFLIPSSFGGETSGGAMTSGYHEALVVGWKPGHLLIRNSWGDNWGIRLGGFGGFTWMPVEYLQRENYHRGLVLAHTPTDVGGTTPPPPPVGVTITGLQKSGVTVREMTVGAIVTLIGTGFDTIPAPVVVRLGGTPTNGVRITRDIIDVLVVEPVGVTGPVTVAGGTAGTILARSSFSVTVKGNAPPPDDAVRISGRVTGNLDKIKIGMFKMDGDGFVGLLFVEKIDRDETPPPPPLGELAVNAQVAGTVVYVNVKDSAGKYVSASVSATSATVQLQAHHTDTNASPDGSTSSMATFRTSGRGEITFSAVTADKRKGTTKVTV